MQIAELEFVYDLLGVLPATQHQTWKRKRKKEKEKEEKEDQQANKQKKNKCKQKRIKKQIKQTAYHYEN